MTRGEKVTHYILSPKERQWLLSIGAELDHDVKDLLQIVTWKTYRRWVHEQEAGRDALQVGRKKIIPQEIIDLIIRMAKENRVWGKVRIVGELRKLSLRISLFPCSGFSAEPEWSRHQTKPSVRLRSFIGQRL